jgi:hypothetical protein
MSRKSTSKRTRPKPKAVLRSRSNNSMAGHRFRRARVDDPRSALILGYGEPHLVFHRISFAVGEAHLKRKIRIIVGLVRGHDLPVVTRPGAPRVQVGGNGRHAIYEAENAGS